MATTVREYNAKVDSKNRITLRNALFDYFHVQEYDDGKILLSPRELESSFEVSCNTLEMMDLSVSNLKEGQVSQQVDLTDFI